MNTETMEAGRELDALVAERVMGFEKRDQWYSDGEYAGFLYVGADGRARGSTEAKCNWFSTRIEAAWEVFTHPRLLADGWEPLIEAGRGIDGVVWEVGFCHAAYDAHLEYVSGASAIPAAICRAALRAARTPDQRPSP